MLDPFQYLVRFFSVFFVRGKLFIKYSDFIYNYYPNARYIGAIDFTLPNLLIRAPKLIREITVKSFEHFTYHKTYCISMSTWSLYFRRTFFRYEVNVRKKWGILSLLSLLLAKWDSCSTRYQSACNNLSIICTIIQNILHRWMRKTLLLGLPTTWLHQFSSESVWIQWKTETTSFPLRGKMF